MFLLTTIDTQLIPQRYLPSARVNLNNNQIALELTSIHSSTVRVNAEEHG